MRACPTSAVTHLYCQEVHSHITDSPLAQQLLHNKPLIFRHPKTRFTLPTLRVPYFGPLEALDKHLVYRTPSP